MFMSNDKFYLLTKQLNGFLVAMRDGDTVTFGNPNDVVLRFIQVAFNVAPEANRFTVYLVSPTGRLQRMFDSPDSEYVGLSAMRLVERCTVHDRRTGDLSNLTWFVSKDGEHAMRSIQEIFTLT
jgi:hypothetical protein